MKLTRRQFVIRGAGALAVLGIAGPYALLESKHLKAAAQPVIKDRTLVVVQLFGGNDGLNTVVPYSSGVYYDSRPNLAIPQSQALPINDQLGFHPALQGFKQLYDQGNLAIIEGAGYPNPDHSHFRSMDIWWTADANKFKNTGWLGDYLDQTAHFSTNPLRAVSIGGTLPKALIGRTAQVPAIQSIDSFKFQIGGKLGKSFTENDAFFKAYNAMYNPAIQAKDLAFVRAKGQSTWDAVDALQQLNNQVKLTGVTYPKSNFSSQLQMVSKMMLGGSNSQIFYTSLGGFDDHANEKTAHQQTLADLGNSLAAFYQDLTAANLQDRVVIVCWSEFGRRVKENGSGGTDHGTAAPMFVIGGRVKGGLYGEAPSLTQLDNGDLKYQIDFRSVYATVIDQWIGGDSSSVLGSSFETLPFIM
ncbi:MAG: hypothetical protein JWN30_2601 [Bacilli bacterium]|nr:hypothetical protein [Bacilli bacterium]